VARRIDVIHRLLPATLAILASSAVPAAAMQVTVKPDPVVRIMAQDASGTEPLGRVAWVALDSHDRVLIADGALERIVAYDERGVPRASAGREGSGPGEYTMPEWIGVCLPSDSVAVYDLTAQRLSILDSQLEFVRTINVTGTPSQFACAADGYLWYLDMRRSGPMTAASSRAVAAVRRLDLHTGSTTTVSEHQPLTDLVSLDGFPSIALHGRMTSLAVRGSNVIVATGDSMGRSIIPATGGAARKLAQVTWPAIEPTDATRSATAARFTSRMPDVAVANVMMKRMLAAPQPDIDVYYRRVLVDPMGMIWTQHSLPGEPVVRLAIESIDGKSLGNVTLRVNGDVLAVGRTRLAILSEIDDAPAVLVYAFERGG
jgi:hypothetical protein